MKVLLRILLFFLLWRVFLFLPLAAGDNLLPYRSGYEFTNIWKFKKPYTPVSSSLLYPWANFDGVHYLLIAGQGYTNNFGFFPLFPLVIYSFSSLLQSNTSFDAIEFFTALLITNIAFFTALVVFYKLLVLDYPKKIAYKTLLFLLIFPTSFYFVSIYSESIFLLLALLSFYLARRNHWFLASFVAMLLVSTRIVGIAILPALLAELAIQQRLFINWKTIQKENLSAFLKKSMYLLFAPLGLIMYSFYNWQQTGDFIYFLHAHGNLSNGRSVDTLIFPLQTLFRYGKIFITFNSGQYEWWIAQLELTSFLFAIILLVVAWKKKVRTSYLIFSLFAFIVPVLSGTLSGLPRYCIVLFPIFIAFALVKNKIIQYLYLLVSVFLLFILLLYFSKGYFVA